MTCELKAQLARATIRMDEILVAVSTYPGTSKTADELLQEAEGELKPYVQE